jgi:hypothetical protein
MSVADEISALRQKLAARRNTPGFAANAKAIEARIAILEAQ